MSNAFRILRATENRPLSFVHSRHYMRDRKRTIYSAIYCLAALTMMNRKIAAWRFAFFPKINMQFSKKRGKFDFFFRNSSSLSSFSRESLRLLEICLQHRDNLITSSWINKKIKKLDKLMGGKKRSRVSRFLEAARYDREKRSQRAIFVVTTCLPYCRTSRRGDTKCEWVLCARALTGPRIVFIELSRSLLRCQSLRQKHEHTQAISTEQGPCIPRLG